MSRKLASIRLIDAVLPHHNADALDLVQIDGWQCVATKGEFKPGDICVYFEIGAFLPVRPEFEFLRKGCFKEHPDLGPGFRIKTIKLRGELAQGLAVPIKKLPDAVGFIEFVMDGERTFEEAVQLLFREDDTDLTEILGVKKYEVPERNSGGVNCGRSKSTFPDFIPKTDQERIQNLYRKYSEMHKHDEWEVTMKLDGSSMTVFCNLQEGFVVGEEEDEIVNGLNVNAGICSRNMNLRLAPVGEPAGDFVNFSNETGLLDCLIAYCKATGRSLALQGELMGPRIQKNREGFGQHHFYLFDVFDIEKQQYLDANERLDVYYGLHMVRDGDVPTCAAPIERFYHSPVIDPAFAVFEEFGNLDDLLDWVNKAPSINHPVAEGYVFKNLSKPHISFKCISNRFLIGYDTED